MALNKLSRGRIGAGRVDADIQATAGSIGSTELATNAVTTVKITAANVTDPKIAYSIEVTPSSTTALTGFGTKNLTAPGSSAGRVYDIGTPTAGDHYRLWATGTIGGSSAPVCVKSTAATFDGTNVVVKFQVTNNYADIHALSTARWLTATNGSTGVVLAATT
jgi:hypothetical protein